MMDNEGAVRNLEQIQEEEREGKGAGRAVTVALVALGAACVGFAAIALGGHASKEDGKKVDPLGDLVTQKAKGSATRAPDLQTHEVTFPSVLSDQGSPTTALAAVRPSSSVRASESAPVSVLAEPPPPTDKLPVVPVPAQDVLQASPVVTRPRDALTKTAAESAQITTAPSPGAPAGHEGGYQLQVSSFRTANEANLFADQLRARGHKAYVQEARVPSRGTWYRVRVGPFASQHAAASYRSQFEAKEHVVPFIVPPKE